MTEVRANSVESRLRAAFDAASSGLLMIDPTGNIVMANRAIERLFGYAEDELLGRSVEALVPERLRGEHPLHRDAFTRNPRVRPMAAGTELYGLRKDGIEVPLEIGLTPVATDEGLFVLGTVVDLTSRVQAERRFKIAVESAPSGMLMIDRTGRITLVNREIERMFEWPRAALLGQSIEVLVPERFRARHPSDRTRYFEAPHTRAMGAGRELFGLRRNGQEFPVEIGLNPIETQEGTLVLASVVDISLRKNAERERGRLEDQLRHAQKMEAIGRFASGIAHDFNNLLMGIIGCGELARRSLPAGHEVRELLAEMCGAAERGATLTRDLLDYSRKRPPASTPTDVNAVVHVAERMLRQIIGEDVEIDVQLSTEGASILANPTHIEHILLNLAVNARDAMPNGGRLAIGTNSVRMHEPFATRGRTLDAGRYVALVVEDSGCGMDAHSLECMFEPFFTTKPAGQGTGLGLFTVYSIVSQLGGGIEVESWPGQGSKFVVYFPALPSDSTSRPPRIDVPQQPGRESTATILVLEDERLIRATLRQLLTGMGHQVLVAENAAAALALARSHAGRIDLLLSDMVLPDGSGTEVARALGVTRPDMRVLFMSAYPADLLRNQGRIGPTDRALEKPFDAMALEHAVTEILARVDHDGSQHLAT